MKSIKLGDVVSIAFSETEESLALVCAVWPNQGGKEPLINAVTVKRVPPDISDETVGQAHTVSSVLHESDAKASVSSVSESAKPVTLTTFPHWK